MSRDELRGMAAVMVRRAQLASLLLLGCVSVVIAADKVAELSDDFLEYLGSLEGDEESWMDFAESAKPQTQVDSKLATSKVTSSASSSSASSRQSQPAHAASNTSAASQAGKVEK